MLLKLLSAIKQPFTDKIIVIVMMMNPPGVCDISLEEVSAMITHAKLIESDLLPLSQVVR